MNINNNESQDKLNIEFKTINNLLNEKWNYEIIDKEYITIKEIPNTIFNLTLKIKTIHNEYTGTATVLVDNINYRNKAIIQALNNACILIKSQNTNINKETQVNNMQINNKLKDKIRNDQIQFLKEFEAKNNINSADKMNYYIKTWGNINNINITNKKELIMAGEEKIDLFISWVKTIQSTTITEEGVMTI